jgi:hypothetical protein
MVVPLVDGNYGHMAKQSSKIYIMKVVFDNSTVNTANYLIRQNSQKLIMGEILIKKY